MINFFTAVLLVLFAAFSRLLPHPENFAPVAAVALFSGFYLSRRYALIIPLAATLLSDVFIGFYSGMWWVYGSYILIGLLSMAMKNKIVNAGYGKKASYIYGTALASSVIFFLVTNFGVWVTGYYGMTFKGLITCYGMAIPFFRTSLLADILYITIMAGVYEFLIRFTAKTETAKLSRLK